MLDRRSLTLVVLIAVGAPQCVGASPITYDFTGSLNPSFAQPINGTYQISGSFTINANTTAGPVSVAGPGTEVTENGSGVSLTLNAGGQTFNFVNTSQNPGAATFTAIQWAPGSPADSTTGPFDEVQLAGSQQNGSTLTSFSMSFYNPGGAAVLANPGSFVYNLGSSSFNFTVATTTLVEAGGSGTITSIEAVPEPSGLMVFAVLGMTVLFDRRRRARRRLDSRC